MLVWAANGAVTAISVRGWYRTLVQPPLAPPNWVFAPVWTVLYVSMGVAAWLVWRRIDIGAHRKRRALRMWGWQLLANALWPAAFFGFQSIGVALAVIVVLLAAITATIRLFWPLHRVATLLLLPYLAWVGFAAYLNTGFWWLNPV